MNIEEIYKQYQANLSTFLKIEKYFKGETDAKSDYKQNAGRSNNWAGCNYIKKFVKEETSYSVGNPITYASKSGNENIVDSLDSVMENFNENHDINVFANMVLFSKAYEILFIDKFGDLQAKSISPVNGYHLEDEQGNTTAFIHCYKRVNEKGEVIEYVDYYDSEYIYHLDKEGKEIAEATKHVFDEVPVGVAKLSEYGVADTLFNDIKGLQDALETNLSDITNEVSDFRNSYMVARNLELGDDDAERAETAKKLKELGLLILGEDGELKFLEKNVNDTFIQNTLKTLQDKIYELTSHVNHNDSEATSNASGVALKSRLISLMQRCNINQNSYKELLKTRIRIILNFLSLTGEENNWKDIKITFTPCIPSDDAQIADMITKLDGIVSKSTLRTLLTFVENSAEEQDKIDKEMQDTYGSTGFEPTGTNLDVTV